MSERRHRISGQELPHVTIAIENQLREWLQYRREEHRYAAEHLFRLWYRIQVHSVGKPDYPEFGWGTVEEHLGPTTDMVPLSGLSGGQESPPGAWGQDVQREAAGEGPDGSQGAGGEGG